MIGQPCRQDPLVADRPVREDQRRSGMAQGEFGEPVGERRQPAPGVDQDRHGGPFGEREHAVHLLAVEPKCLRPRMQLDPVRARRKATLGLVDRVFGGIEPAERNQPLSAFGGPAEHAVVGNAIGGMARGVVQRKDAGAAGVGGVELREQLCERQRASILVEPEVGMGVDDFGALRAHRLDFGEKRRQGVRVERLVHVRHLIRSRATARS